MGNKDSKIKKPAPNTSTPSTQQGRGGSNTTPAPSSQPKSPGRNPSTSSSSKSSGKEDLSVFSLPRLEALFDKYKDEEDAIGPTELEKFCQDIDVDPDDVVMLAIAYQLKCKEMGYFSREEFVKGFELIQCDTLDKIKQQIPRFKKDLTEPAKFQAIYRFAFQFAKEQEQKCLGIEIAQGLLSLLLVDSYPVAKSFVEFLKVQDQYKVINSDQWSSLLEFCRTVEPDFSNYDENGAWPCILDEWVTWVKEKKAE